MKSIKYRLKIQLHLLISALPNGIWTGDEWGIISRPVDNSVGDSVIGIIKIQIK